MALKATIFKAELNVANMDSHYYQSHSLTLARHPSETDERMMVRVLAFAMHAHEHLQWGKGLSAEDEPDIWQKALTDEIDVWIDLGQPDEKRLRKACGRAKQVFIYTYQPRSASVWAQQNQELFKRFENLSVAHLSAESTTALGLMANRTMDLQCSIQDGEVSFSDGKQHIVVDIAR